MSGKNFTELEVGAWYRQRSGHVGICGVNNRQCGEPHRYPFTITDTNGEVTSHTNKGTFYEEERREHLYDAIERVANAQGDPWPPVQPLQFRPFKVGDRVHVSKTPMTSSFGSPQHRYAGSEGVIDSDAESDMPGVKHADGVVLYWVAEDLMLIKAVDEPEQPQQVEEAPKAEEVTVWRNLEVGCRLGDCVAFLTSAGSIYLSDRDRDPIQSSECHYDRESLDGLITVLSRLRDELRGAQ